MSKILLMLTLVFGLFAVAAPEASAQIQYGSHTGSEIGIKVGVGGETAAQLVAAAKAEAVYDAEWKINYWTNQVNANPDQTLGATGWSHYTSENEVFFDDLGLPYKAKVTIHWFVNYSFGRGL